MLHSGSRNVGNTTASFYDKVAGNRPGREETCEALECKQTAT